MPDVLKGAVEIVLNACHSRDGLREAVNLVRVGSIALERLRDAIRTQELQLEPFHRMVKELLDGER